MQAVELQLGDENFLRVHRSFIIRLGAINKIELASKDTWTAILIDNTKIPVSKNGYSKLRQVLGI